MLMKSKKGRVVSMGEQSKTLDGSFTLKGDSNFRQIQNDKFHTGCAYILTLLR
jgi:hypothetical protein